MFCYNTHIRRVFILVIDAKGSNYKYASYLASTSTTWKPRSKDAEMNELGSYSKFQPALS